MHCPQCGAVVSEGKKFCTACGAELSLPTDEKACPRCGKKRPPLSIGFNKTTGRCNRCEKEVAKAERRFKTLFLNACKDGLLEEHEWHQFDQFCAEANVPLAEMLQSVKAEALSFVERTLTFAKADEIITPAEEAAIYALQRRLLLTGTEVQHIKDEIEYVKLITNIRQGKIPTIKPTVILGADELCHWEAPTVYMKPLKKGPTPYKGRMVVTNKRVMFLAPRGGTEFSISKIVRIAKHFNGVFLELSRRTGNGFYRIDRPDIVGEVFASLVRIHNRQLVTTEGGPSRHIPHDVKIAVWQRDQGKCIQCGATDYLEFDHIIPFSKGGASSVNNVQLLCRRCNLKKADSI